MSKHPLSLQVERSIYLIRGEKVMFDYDLAVLYGVETRAQAGSPSQRRPLPGRFHVRAYSG